jgi:hypothetical protein
MLGLKLSAGGIDGATPETKEQFEDLEKLIGNELLYSRLLLVGFS